MNLYGYVGENPMTRWDPLGLAWDTGESTQGIHYNDRATGFAFRLDTNSEGRVCAVPAVGKNHTFDQAKADKILRKAMANKPFWNDLQKKVATNFDNQSWRNKDYLRSLGRAMRRAGAVSAAIAAVAGVESARAQSEPICNKIRSGQQLSDYEKFSFLEILNESGIPGKEAIGSEFVDHHFLGGN